MNVSATTKQGLVRWLSAGVFWLSVLPALALPFTYQGRLVDGAALANGNYELRFRLFDSLTAGNQVGGNISLPSVAVTNGLWRLAILPAETAGLRDSAAYKSRAWAR